MVAHGRLEPPDTLGAVPDRRRPRALLDRLGDARRAAALEVCRHHIRARAIHAEAVAGVGGPATRGVLEHARVVEGALPNVELRVRPGGAQRVEPGAGRRAGGRIDARAVVRIADDVDHLLLRVPVRVDPAFHDLDALERRTGESLLAGVLRCQHDEGRPVAVDGADLAAHGDALAVAHLDQVRPGADGLGVPAGEEADDRPCPARAVDLPPSHRGEDRVSGVLLRPHHREPARAVLDVRPPLRVEAAARVGCRSVGVENAGVARPLVLAHAARDAVVIVGGGDETEPEGVHLDRLLLLEAFLQRVPDERERREGVRGGAVAEERHPVGGLEGAKLVRRANSRLALRAGLGLVDLDQRLAGSPDRGVGGRERAVVRVLRQEHPARAHVRVVRNREPVAAGEALLAGRAEHCPEPLRRRLLDVADRQRGDVVVPEDHVPMEVVSERGSAPLVADEARERAGSRAIVELLGRGADVVPDDRGLVETVRAPVAAEGPAVGHRQGHDRDEEPGQGIPDGREVAGLALHDRVPELRALVRVVTVLAWCEADVALAESLRMVGHGGEVERPPEPERASRMALRVVGREPDLLPGRETVGVARCVTHVEDRGVDGVDRVDVRLAEVGPAEEIEARARRPRLGAGPRPGSVRPGGRGGEAACEAEHEEQDCRPGSREHCAHVIPPRV